VEGRWQIFGEVTSEFWPGRDEGVKTEKKKEGTGRENGKRLALTFRREDSASGDPGRGKEGKRKPDQCHMNILNLRKKLPPGKKIRQRIGEKDKMSGSNVVEGNVLQRCWGIVGRQSRTKREDKAFWLEQSYEGK